MFGFTLDSLPVALWAFVVSQIFGLLNIGLAVYRYKVKKRDRAINIKIAGNFTKLLNLAFLLNFTLVGLKIVSIAKNLTMKKVTKDGSQVKTSTSIMLLILFCLIKAIIVLIMWLFSGLWFEWIILATALFAMIGKWQKNMHLMRVSSLVNTIAIFVNSLFFFLNFTSLLKAVFVVTSILIFYIVFFVKRAKSKHQVEADTAKSTSDNESEVETVIIRDDVGFDEVAATEDT